MISPTPGVALFNLAGSSSLLALFAVVCSLEGGVTSVLVTVLVEALAKKKSGKLLKEHSYEAHCISSIIANNSSQHRLWKSGKD